MDAIRKAILACMQNCDPDDDLVESLNKVIAQEGDEACKVILEILTHLDFEPQVAVRHWQEIVAHQAALSEALRRPVNLPVTVCDYFHWVKRSIGFPKLVDVYQFEEIFHRNQHDFLTNLYNREAFEEALRQEIARAKRYGRKLSLLFIDVDSFKAVNDTHGHLAGDAVLRGVGKILAAKKRMEDLAARYGGDEFVLLLPDTDKKEALVLAERIRASVADRNMAFGGQPMRVTISGGVATFPDDGSDSLSLRQYADEALYRAKRNGKNAVLFHKPNGRKFVRVPFVKQLNIRALPPPDDVAAMVKSKDLCCGGILIENQFPIDVGSLIEINMGLNDEPVAIQGKVVRTRQLASDRFDIGVSFLEEQAPVKTVLGDYVLNTLPQWSNSWQ
ncbi:diguanylate cyclase [Thiovibrio sp. JS02]